MYQGETITTTITGFPIPVSEIKDLRVIFKNNFKTLLEKTFADCRVVDESVEFTISQEESLSLSAGKIARSVIVITKDGSRLESCPSYIICEPTARNEVLT